MAVSLASTQGGGGRLPEELMLGAPENECSGVGTLVPPVGVYLNRNMPVSMPRGGGRVLLILLQIFDQYHSDSAPLPVVSVEHPCTLWVI